MSAPSMRELIAKATPGPWQVAPYDLTPMEQSAPLRRAVNNPDRYCDVCRFLSGDARAEVNAEYVSRLSPDVVSKVMDALEAARDAMERHPRPEFRKPVLNILSIERILNGETK